MQTLNAHVMTPAGISASPHHIPRRPVIDNAFAAIAVAQYLKDNGVLIKSITANEFTEPQILVDHSIHVERLFPDAKKCSPLTADARAFNRHEAWHLGVSVTWTKP